MPKNKNSIKIIPYRNTMKKNEDFILDKKVTYEQDIGAKPRGFWYQINDCGYKWGELDWGNYIYNVEIYLSNILVIKNYQDYLKFDKEYGINMTYEFEKTSMNSNNDYNGLPNTYTQRYIDWRKVSKRYSGIEVKNYNKIQEQLTKDYIRTHIESWLEWYDFSQGCIWDLTAVKSVSYCCKFSKQLQLNSMLINNRASNNRTSNNRTSNKVGNMSRIKLNRKVSKSSSKKTKKKIKDAC